MIDGKSVLAVIPARGGSKGVPRKNIRTVGGKPLIAWTIEEAKKSRYIDRLILSSEDEEIIKVAKEWGCDVPFLRPAELAQDNTPGIEPVFHAISQVPGYDYVVLLQPTSPLRLVSDIDCCVETCLKMAAPACVSVTITDKSPFWMYTLKEGKRLSPLLENKTYSCRQELPPVYVLNGAVYVARVDWLIRERNFIGNETVAYPMSKEGSLDIDNELDVKIFQVLIENSMVARG